MSYADDREYSRAQKTALIVEHLITRGPLTIVEAQSMVGGGYWNTWCILLEIEAVLGMRMAREGKQRCYVGRVG